MKKYGKEETKDTSEDVQEYRDENIDIGIINDPANVFKLAMLENEIEKIQLQYQLSLKHIDEQATALVIKKNQLSAQFNLNFKELKSRHSAHKEYIEEKHKIGLAGYIYDDELGILRKREDLIDTPVAKKE